MREKVFVDGVFTAIDFARPDGRSEVTGETLEQIRKRYPAAELVEADPWYIAKEKALCTEPAPVTFEKWWEMLEVLPPQNWQRGKNCESFEMSEHTSGRITEVYVRLGRHYYAYCTRVGQSLAAHVTACGGLREGFDWGKEDR